MLTLLQGKPRATGLADASRVHLGYAPGGPQDRLAAARANALVGNPPQAALLEFTLGPVAFEFRQKVAWAMTGAPGEINRGGVRLSMDYQLGAEAGDRVRFQFHPHLGCRCYLAVAGGFDLATVRDTAVDFAIGSTRRAPRMLIEPLGWQPPLSTVRVLPGPEATPEQLAVLLETPWRVHPDSSGVGLRLAGRRLPEVERTMTSVPVTDGTVQATPDGPFILLRERGTLGGYPRLATLVDADVDRAVQFRPGQTLHFELVTEAAAEQIETTYQARVQQCREPAATRR